MCALRSTASRVRVARGVRAQRRPAEAVARVDELRAVGKLEQDAQGVHVPREDRQVEQRHLTNQDAQPQLERSSLRQALRSGCKSVSVSVSDDE
eukprot:2439026-Pleurochrysis_carterae.AAC.1